MKKHWIVVGCAWLIASAPAISRAQEVAPIPSVDVFGCSNVSPTEVTRLLALELAVWGESPPEPEKYRISISCTSTDATILLADEFSQERLRRTFPLGQSIHEAPERTLANATAELLHALNWVRPQEPTEPANAPVPAPVQPQETSPEASATASTGSLGAELGFGVSGLLMVRSLQTKAIVQPGVGGLIRLNLGQNFGAAISADWASGQLEKASGKVTAKSWSAGLVLLGKWPSGQNFFGEGRLSILARHVTLRGDASGANVLGETISGFLPDLLLQAGPAFRWHEVQLTVLGSAGLTLSNLKGSVADDSDLNYGGFWLGATLEASWYPESFRF